LLGKEIKGQLAASGFPGHAVGLFDLEDYVSEARVPEETPAVGLNVHEIEELTADSGAVIVGVIRKGRSGFGVARREAIQAGDLLVIEAGPDDIDSFINSLKLEVVGVEGSKAGLLSAENMVLVEAVVPPRARIERRSVHSERLRTRFGVTLLAVSRQGRPIRERLMSLTLKAGDVLLLQGDQDRLPEAISARKHSGKSGVLLASRRTTLPCLGQCRRWCRFKMVK